MKYTVVFFKVMKTIIGKIMFLLVERRSRVNGHVR